MIFCYYLGYIEEGFICDDGWKGESVYELESISVVVCLGEFSDGIWIEQLFEIYDFEEKIDEHDVETVSGT